MQKEKRTSYLKIHRQGDPLTCQRIWDLIKDLRVERKLAATKENVVQEYCKKYNVEGKYVRDQLKFLLEDKLIQQKTIAAVKGSNKGIEQNIYVIPLESEIDLTGKNDWYCFECHKPGEVLNCISCPRVYHVKCLENLEAQNTDAFICPFCKGVKADHKVLEDQDARRELNDLVYYACARLEEKLPLEKYGWKENALNNNAVTPHTTDRCAARLSKITKETINSCDEKEWRTRFLLRFPLITVPKIMDKADRQVYKSLDQFQMDSLIIVHNVTVFYGENDILADAARTMLRTCKYEIGEINLCRDCYKRSNEPEGPDWFCLPCNPPHELVYAKAQGFPYWPAKVLSITNDMYDVRFFGQGHDRLTLNKMHTKSIDAVKAPAKKSVLWCKAVEEFKKHQMMLAEQAGSSIETDEQSDDEMSNEEENDVLSTSNPTLNLKSCSVSINTLDYQALFPNKIEKRLEPVISGSELPFTEERVISTEESNADHAMLDLSNLMALQGNPIFPEGNEIETAEKVMKDFTVSAAAFQTSESKIELLEAKEKMAVLDKEINIKQQKIEEQMRLIERQEKEIEDLKESSDSKIQILQQQIEALKESHASKSQAKQQEMETLKESHASAIRILLENHTEEIAKTKTKIWCSNQCGSEGLYHCCMTTSYCNNECQLDHWKKGHKKSCKRDRVEKEAKEHSKRGKDYGANK